MNLKMFLFFLIISSSPVKAVISSNTHMDERDARIFNFPHCTSLLSVRNISWGRGAMLPPGHARIIAGWPVTTGP